MNGSGLGGKTAVPQQTPSSAINLSMSNLTPQQLKLVQEDLAERERQASALAAAGMVAETVDQSGSGNLQNMGHGIVGGTSGMTWQGLHAPPVLAAMAPLTTSPGGTPAEGTDWNDMDMNLDDMEMDFAKLFDPAHEVANMQTEGSGWPTTSGTDVPGQPLSPTK